MAGTTSPIKSYLAELERNLQTGDATEPSHYPALQRFLEALSRETTATTNPRRIECGAPDFVIRKRVLTVGYVEAKDVGQSLDSWVKSEQLKRYLEALPNLVLTNYLEFRWYVRGEFRRAANLGTLGQDGRIRLDPVGATATADLLADFLIYRPEGVGTARDLATFMARMAHMIRDLIVAAFDREAEAGPLHTQREAFRKHLIPDLTEEQFADMYAQTIAYGLFAARAAEGPGQGFTRERAAYLVPRTNPFLRRLFNSIAGPELDDRIAWLVDDLAQLLAQADMATILKDFGRRTRKEDPVVHFYETFLTAYDPKIREMRGVYYTPEPVVSYIVRSLDHLLRSQFSRPEGLADPNTLILDPAVGTATFLYWVVKEIHDKQVAAGQQGVWNEYVETRLLPRLFGFELLMAPYAVAHAKLGLQLQETGYEFTSDQRLGVYLTNSLEEQVDQPTLPFEEWITDEAISASDIKRNKPIMVVLGNPPYSGHSANSSYRVVREVVTEARRRGKTVKLRIPREVERRVPTFIGALMEDYRLVDGKPLGERNPKWLQDDYVKFIRFGQWRIERTGAGVLAFITNHAYLDNPTFRGMRQQLMEKFTSIYILDLHGNTKKRERAPDGSEDQNVFDIQQGVSIGIFVKRLGEPGPARVYHEDRWGNREAKYEWLLQHHLADTSWKELHPQAPFYLFTPQPVELREEYERAWKVTELLPVSSVGIVTGQDAATIATTHQGGLTLAQNKGISPASVIPLLYRPFDFRYVAYDAKVVTRQRTKVMRHMLAGENLGLISARSNKSPDPDHFFCSRLITEAKCGEATTQSCIFPLYLFPLDQEVASGLYRKDEKQPNLAAAFTEELGTVLGLEFVVKGATDLEHTFGPEDVFHYMYAMFHSPTYRTRYAEFLKIDFPRVPVTSELEVFKALAERGKELVGLHLMESPLLERRLTRYPVEGSNLVEKVRYQEPDEERPGRVWINKTQYFEGVSPEVWEFHVGGYQICEKWLRARKGRNLSYDDAEHYQKVVVALHETLRLMAQIDAVIPSWPIK